MVKDLLIFRLMVLLDHHQVLGVLRSSRPLVQRRFGRMDHLQFFYHLDHDHHWLAIDVILIFRFAANEQIFDAKIIVL